MTGGQTKGKAVSPWLVAALTTMVMTLFAANSLLCRFALAPGPSSQPLDPSVYTALRAISAAAMLWLIQARRGGNALRTGSWAAALALFGYMACFSWAYVRLSAGAGALVIAVAVQAGMLVAGLRLGRTRTCEGRVGATVADVVVPTSAPFTVELMITPYSVTVLEEA